MILGIDPGKRGLAIARLLNTGQFYDVKCWALPKDPLATIAGWGPSVRAHIAERGVYSQVFCEEMRYYPQAGSAKSSSEIKAILVLQAIGGLVAGWAGCPYVFFSPAADWKGQLPKKICHNRIESRLAPTELAMFQDQIAQYKKQDDCWDSLGIALFGAGRFRV